MLVIVKDRDLHALAEFALDVETIGGLDVLKINATKSRLKGGHRIDDLVEVSLGQLDVKDINARKLLKEHALALHDRLGRQGTNVAQAQDRRAIGDDTHEVAPGGVLKGIDGVFGNLETGRRDPGGIGQGKVTLIGELLGGQDGDLPWGGELVVIEGLLAQNWIHLGVPRRGGLPNYEASEALAMASAAVMVGRPARSCI